METVEHFIQLLQKVGNEFTYDIDNTKDLIFESIISDSIVSFCKSKEIEYQQLGLKIHINKSELPFSFFYDISEFINEVKPAYLKKGMIYQYENIGSVIFGTSTSPYSSDNVKVSELSNLVTNTACYFKFIDFVKRNSNLADGEFEFTNSFSTTTRRISLTDLKQKRKISFKYPQSGIPEHLGFEVNYADSFENFISLYNDNRQYPAFLKEAVVLNLASSDDFIPDFFKKLPKIINDAQLNFNVFIHELSLEKIKKEYSEYKQKYFNSQNDVLNKISNQVLALPISIAGLLFAIDKLEGQTLPIIIACGVLGSFLGYALFLASIYFRDLLEIDKQTARDYSILQSEKFFKENDSELIYFSTIKGELDDRIAKLQTGLKVYSLILWLSTIATIMYGLKSISNLNDINLLFFTSAFLILYYFVQKTLFEKTNLKPANS
jgi:hypothetical protein